MCKDYEFTAIDARVSQQRSRSLSGPLDYVNVGLNLMYLSVPREPLVLELSQWPAIRVMFVRICVNAFSSFNTSGWIAHDMETAWEFHGLEWVILTWPVGGRRDNDHTEQVQRSCEKEVAILNADCERKGRIVRFQWLSQEDFKKAWFQIEKGFIGWSEDRKDEYKFLEYYDPFVTRLTR